jgi:hypothetical protein
VVFSSDSDENSIYITVGCGCAELFPLLLVVFIRILVRKSRRQLLFEYHAPLRSLRCVVCLRLLINNRRLNYWE